MRTSLAESNNKYEMAFWLTELARALPTFKLSADSNLNLTRTDDIVHKYVDSRKKHFRVLAWAVCQRHRAQDLGYCGATYRRGITAYTKCDYHRAVCSL